MSALNTLVARALPYAPRALVRPFAAPYVAGETRAQALAAVTRLAAEGCAATIDRLGEDARDEAEAHAYAAEYTALIADIAARGLAATTGVSIKLTGLGLRAGEAPAARRLETVVAAGAAAGVFTAVDMEDATLTDATLRVVSAVHRVHPAHVGPVLQASLKRTVADIRALAGKSPLTVRLCKGIYRERPQVQWQGYETVRAAYAYGVERLWDAGALVGAATHDEHLVWAVLTLADRLGIDRSRFEFQMLMGVAPALRRELVDRGYTVRVYVPYGPDWYAYSLRRLRENPAVAGHVAAATVRRLLGR